MITVFYDGQCGLCRREINHYQKIAKAGVFEWVDITVTPTPFTDLGLSINDGLKALHVIAPDNTLQVGVSAFIVIWQALPGAWKLLGIMAGLPIIRPCLMFIYRHFADWRFKRLGYGQCDI